MTILQHLLIICNIVDKGISSMQDAWYSVLQYDFDTYQVENFEKEIVCFFYLLFSFFFMPDQEITCRDCGGTFTFTEGEQEFYTTRNYTPPLRCKRCRQSRKSGPRQLYDAVCAQCSAQCQVPFEPKGDRPVLCRECFATKRAEG